MSAIYTGGFMAYEDTAKGMSMVQKPLNGGVQRQYKFSNGYGASVIKTCLLYTSDAADED